jgi:hypothetical protein
MHLAEGLCLDALLTLKVKFSYLPCRHRNTNSVDDGMVIDFVLENSNRPNKQSIIIIIIIIV